MDMNALFAAKVAERTAKGFIADSGMACRSAAARDYMNFRDEMMRRADWGNLPAELKAKLVAMKALA